MNDKHPYDAVNDQSVTVVVTRRVVPGREADYKQWAAEIGQVSERFPGHLGATLQGPTDANEYHIIFRFDTVEHLRHWENSNERAELIEKLSQIVEGEARVERYCGLEFLFSSAVAPVQKYKMALVLTGVVFLMILILRPIVATVFPGLPATAQLFVTVMIQVAAMTYIVMPYVTRLLKNWLHG
ncbi:MAG: antibiotic biosynthesis monooxygenase [Pseudomonadales bacterium]